MLILDRMVVVKTLIIFEVSIYSYGLKNLIRGIIWGTEAAGLMLAQNEIVEARNASEPYLCFR